MILAVGFLVMSGCLAFQVLASAVAARYFARAAGRPAGSRPWVAVSIQFSVVMIVLTLGNVVQISIWALLYRALGALGDWTTALYFSGVTFTTLGYGDVVLHDRMRLLAPLQAANGVMMFGITTAVFMATVQRAIANWSERHPPTAVE